MRADYGLLSSQLCGAICPGYGLRLPRAMELEITGWAYWLEEIPGPPAAALPVMVQLVTTTVPPIEEIPPPALYYS